MDMFTDEFSVDILDEAFYGKSSRLAKCDALMNELIETVKSSTDKKYDINDDPRVQEIEALMEREFNLAELTLTFYYPVPQFKHAYTVFSLPTVIPLFNKDEMTRYGIDTSNYRLNCHVDVSMLQFSGLTGSEVMAMMLHEIGHNFDSSVFFLLSKINIDVFSAISDDDDKRVGIVAQLGGNVIDLIIGGLIGKTVSYIISELDKITTKLYNAMPPRVRNGVSKGMANFESLFGSIVNGVSVVNIFKSGPIIFLQNLNPANIFGYGTEKFGDSFATAHGYGTELASALHTLDQGKGLIFNDIANKSALFAIPYDLYKVVTDIAVSPFRAHPKTPVRIKSQLNKLKRDLQDPNLDPKIKKELLQNIRELENFIQTDYTSITKDENKTRTIQVLYNKAMMSKMSYTDYREWLQLVNRREL